MMNFDTDIISRSKAHKVKIQLGSHTRPTVCFVITISKFANSQVLKWTAGVERHWTGMTSHTAWRHSWRHIVRPTDNIYKSIDDMA